jgi:hypothetical protein
MRIKTAGINVLAPRSDYSDVTRAKGRMGAELKFSGQEVGGTFDCRAGHVGRHAMDDY